jgi:porphobilinogen synthase
MSRLRRTQKIRALVRETHLTINDLVYPIFVRDGARTHEPLEGMPGQFRIPLDDIATEVDNIMSLGIPAIIIFGLPLEKDTVGSSAFDSNGIVQKAVRLAKKRSGDNLVVMTDVCLCQYTSHGHCGIVEEGNIVNDKTLEILQKIAVSQSEAGTDVVAPSGMMDGQVAAIRSALDNAGYQHVSIMAYSAKHASCFYGPFREAAESAPSFGDRRSYQMDYGNANEAMREIESDIKEGADIVMVKPALAYLDLIYRAKRRFGYPTATYNVSGEYAMVKAAAEKGWMDEKAAVLEILTAMKRSGADMILTYFAKDVAKWLTEK